MILYGDPTVNLEAATKEYVDNNYVNKAGDTMTGSLLFNNTTTDPTYIGCNNLANTKSINVVLGSLNNQISFARNDANQLPITMATSNGCLFRLGANDILRVGKDSGDIRVVASQPVILYGDPTANLEAATKQYVDNKRVCNNVGLITQLNSNTN